MASCRIGPSPHDRSRPDSMRSDREGRLVMRWVTVATDEGPRACGAYQGEYIDVNAADPEMPSSVRDLLELGHEWERRAWAALPRGIVRHDPAKVRLLAPVPDPRKIVCIG